MLLIMIKLIVNVNCFFISNILVGLEIDYTCLGGSWNGKFGNPCSREQINETWTAATN